MSQTEPRTDAATLRTAFDRGFAAPPATAREFNEGFIAIRIGETRHAIAMTEIGGLVSDQDLVPCPSRRPELLGLAGLRGSIVPVFDLGMLVGAARGGGRWQVLAADGLVGFAFGGFDGHFSARRPPGAPNGRRVIDRDGIPLPLIELARITAALGGANPTTPEEP